MKKSLTPDEMLATLQKQVIEAGSAYNWARWRKIDLGYLSRTLRGQVPIGGKIMDALGYRKVVTVSYEKIEDAE